jgi:hypothetical protein
MLGEKQCRHVDQKRHVLHRVRRVGEALAREIQNAAEFRQRQCVAHLRKQLIEPSLPYFPLE